MAMWRADVRQLSWISLKGEKSESLKGFFRNFGV